MPLSKQSRWIVGAAVALPLAALAIAPVREAAWDAIVPTAQANLSDARLEAVIAERKLYVTLPGGETKVYNVAVGTAKYPTPTGTFRIHRIVWNPGWVPPASPWARGKRARGPSDPGNPMKVAKIFFKEPDYYLHGTGHVESLGSAASHGCLRMHPDDVAELGAALMQAGGVAHDWEWVKRTLSMGSTRTINLKRAVPITVRSTRPEPRPASADSVAAPIPAPTDSIVPSSDSTRRVDTARDTARTTPKPDTMSRPR